MQRQEHLAKDGLDTMMGYGFSTRLIGKRLSAVVRELVGLFTGDIQIYADRVQQKRITFTDPGVSRT